MARVLSIQSHVVYGYVGGKAAVFPLQLLGYDVDVVNTVNYSNHSGYGRIGGTKSTSDDLNRIFDVMSQNELLRPDRLLTGTHHSYVLFIVTDFSQDISPAQGLSMP